MYRIVFSKNAKKTIDKLPKDIKSRIRAALQRIKVRPYDFVDKLINHPHFKLRVGDYRIILDIYEEEILIFIIEVGHRQNIYK